MGRRRRREGSAGSGGRHRTRRRTRTDFAVARADGAARPPSCATTNGVYDVFTGTQCRRRDPGAGVSVSRSTVSAIRIHQHYLGGGFGRDSTGTSSWRPPLIAREAGRPVKLIRSREEDLTRGFYRSPDASGGQGGLDAAGTVIGLGSRAGRRPLDRQRLLRPAWTLAGAIRWSSGVPTTATRSRIDPPGSSRETLDFLPDSTAGSRRDTRSLPSRRFWTSWRTSRRPIRWQCAWRCSARHHAWRTCSRWSRLDQAGERPCRSTSAAALPRSRSRSPSSKPACGAVVQARVDRASGGGQGTKRSAAWWTVAS